LRWHTPTDTIACRKECHRMMQHKPYQGVAGFAWSWAHGSGEQVTAIPKRLPIWQPFVTEWRLGHYTPVSIPAAQPRDDGAGAGDSSEARPAVAGAVRIWLAVAPCSRALSAMRKRAIKATERALGAQRQWEIPGQRVRQRKRHEITSQRRAVLESAGETRKPRLRQWHSGLHLERETRLELATTCLEGRRSAN
jgi:hypothetical protein